MDILYRNIAISKAALILYLNHGQEIKNAMVAIYFVQYLGWIQAECYENY